jgi:four helix bundle protein
MKYDRFEDLPVWNDAIELKLALDGFCAHPGVARLRGFVLQMDSAALSISNNIAEGFERGTTNELLMFLYIARGSAGEVRSMLRYAERRADLGMLQPEVRALISRAEAIARQLRGWANALQNSPIEGPRHLTDASRARYEQERRARAFIERLRSDQEERLQRMKASAGCEPAESRESSARETADPSAVGRTPES